MKIFNLIITTKKKQEEYMDDHDIELARELDRVDRMSVWAAVRPVIHSLKELRKNTWDVERVDQAIKWLTDNFEVRK
jgi:UDP-N-acetylglucosamine transferase subunit ALG13